MTLSEALDVARTLCGAYHEFAWGLPLGAEARLRSNAPVTTGGPFAGNRRLSWQKILRSRA